MDQNPIVQFLTRNRGMMFPAASALLIFVILIPMPTACMDLFLLTNILLSTIVLMTVMYIRTPLEFSSFPSLLLAMTLLRLVLNIATVRLVLTNGASGTAAAGHVVETFGVFVAGNSLAVGVIIFIIITVIQFVVITKGATRIAEVAARFTLDGMPGKQMAIDADLNAGTINEEEARRRREEVTREADFFGAMDGASKFVRGDAVAGLIITFVNILGGFYVGMVEHGMDLMRALEVYTKLTIGDGLSSQVPAFILSIGAGMLVTRSTGRTNMGEEVLGQLFAKPVALFLSAGFLGVLMLTSLPKIPLFGMALGCVSLALFTQRGHTAAAAAARRATDEQAKQKAGPPKVETQLLIDPLELSVGFGLVKLVDRNRGGDLLDRISAIRRQTASELGLVVPAVRIRDNPNVEPTRYTVLLRGQEIASGEVYPDQLLAINSGLATQPLNGVETREPSFGLRAYWIPTEERDRAHNLNYTVVEPSGVLATHITEVIKRFAADLLTRAETQNLIENLKQRNAGLVEEVVPALLKTGDIQKVLQNLLRERVPVRDLEAVLETLGDWAPKTKDAEILTEYVRNTLARTICTQYKDATNTIHVITLDPAVEDYIQANIQRMEHGSAITLPPERQSEIAAKLRQQVDAASPRAGGTIAILASPAIRLWVRRMIEPVLPQTPVLGLNEIVRGVEIYAHGVVSIELPGTNIPSGVDA